MASFGRECRSAAPIGYDTHGITFVAAEGCWFKATDGTLFFDATGGSGAVNLGHGHPAVREAVHRQVDQLIHTGWNVPAAVRRDAFERLAAMAPLNDAVVLPCLSGSEAVEAAVKIARAATGRKRVAAFKHGYHGKTMGSLALTWRESFRTYAGLDRSASFHLSAPYVSDGDVTTEISLAQISAELETIGPDSERIAAIVIEPVQVSEGILVPGMDYLAGLIALCRRLGILVIFDEIYTGFGRCGTLFKSSNAGVTPDLLVVGKALGNGFPISAVLGERNLLEVLPSGHHTTTFAGHPVSCAAASAVLDVMAKEQPWHSANSIGHRLVDVLKGLAQQYDFIQRVRSDGLLVGFECWAKDKTERMQPDAGLALRFMNAAFQENVVLRIGGYNGSVVKLTPPLLMADGDLNFLLEALGRAASRVEERH